MNFLDAFKDLENAIKDVYGITVLDYENLHCDGLDKEHLKMCRIARNHIVHSDDKFFEPSHRI